MLNIIWLCILILLFERLSELEKLLDKVVLILLITAPCLLAQYVNWNCEGTGPCVAVSKPRGGVGEVSADTERYRIEILIHRRKNNPKVRLWWSKQQDQTWSVVINWFRLLETKVRIPLTSCRNQLVCTVSLLGDGGQSGEFNDKLFSNRHFLVEVKFEGHPATSTAEIVIRKLVNRKYPKNSVSNDFSYKLTPNEIPTNPSSQFEQVRNSLDSSDLDYIAKIQYAHDANTRLKNPGNNRDRILERNQIWDQQNDGDNDDYSYEDAGNRMPPSRFYNLQKSNLRNSALRSDIAHQYTDYGLYSDSKGTGQRPVLPKPIPNRHIQSKTGEVVYSDEEEDYSYWSDYHGDLPSDDDRSFSTRSGKFTFLVIFITILSLGMLWCCWKKIFPRLRETRWFQRWLGGWFSGSCSCTDLPTNSSSTDCEKCYRQKRKRGFFPFPRTGTDYRRLGGDSSSYSQLNNSDSEDEEEIYSRPPKRSAAYEAWNEIREKSKIVATQAKDTFAASKKTASNMSKGIAHKVTAKGGYCYRCFYPVWRVIIQCLSRIKRVITPCLNFVWKPIHKRAIKPCCRKLKPYLRPLKEPCQPCISVVGICLKPFRFCWSKCCGEIKAFEETEGYLREDSEEEIISTSSEEDTTPQRQFKRQSSDDDTFSTPSEEEYKMASNRNSGRYYKASDRNSGRFHDASNRGSGRYHDASNRYSGRYHDASNRDSGRYHDASNRDSGRYHDASNRDSGRYHDASNRDSGRYHDASNRDSGRYHDACNRDSGRYHDASNRDSGRYYPASNRNSGKYYIASNKRNRDSSHYHTASNKLRRNSSNEEFSTASEEEEFVVASDQNSEDDFSTASDDDSPNTSKRHPWPSSGRPVSNLPSVSNDTSPKKHYLNEKSAYNLNHYQPSSIKKPSTAYEKLLSWHFPRQKCGLHCIQTSHNAGCYLGSHKSSPILSEKSKAFASTGTSTKEKHLKTVSIAERNRKSEDMPLRSGENLDKESAQEKNKDLTTDTNLSKVSTISDEDRITPTSDLYQEIRSGLFDPTRKLQLSANAFLFSEEDLQSMEEELEELQSLV